MDRIATGGRVWDDSGMQKLYMEQLRNAQRKALDDIDDDWQSGRSAAKRKPWSSFRPEQST